MAHLKSTSDQPIHLWLLENLKKQESTVQLSLPRHERKFSEIVVSTFKCLCSIFIKICICVAFITNFYEKIYFKAKNVNVDSLNNNNKKILYKMHF